jgi:hypothetical protein
MCSVGIDTRVIVRSVETSRHTVDSRSDPARSPDPDCPAEDLQHLLMWPLLRTTHELVCDTRLMRERDSQSRQVDAHLIDLK